MNEHILTVLEVAEMLKIKEKTVYRLPSKEVPRLQGRRLIALQAGEMEMWIAVEVKMNTYSKAGHTNE